MQSVFSAETAILIHFKSVGIVFLVFLSIVISLFALTANHCDFYSHFSAPPDKFGDLCPMKDFTSLISEDGLNALFPDFLSTTKKPLRRGRTIILQTFAFVNTFFGFFLLFSGVKQALEFTMFTPFIILPSAISTAIFNCRHNVLSYGMLLAVHTAQMRI